MDGVERDPDGNGGSRDPNENAPGDDSGTIDFDGTDRDQTAEYDPLQPGARDEGTLSFGGAGEDEELAVGSGSYSQLGPYRIAAVIGQGGMGTVFRAEQHEPVRRTVALKLIRRGMDNARVVARFEAERQALASLDHPGIATILDGGTAPDGCPYFVMEFVSGEPFSVFCDDNQLSLRQRLRLFLALCDAVQHAHYRGIVHRDLKPSNVLVGEDESGQPLVRVIDFGVAKAVDTSLTDRALDTEVGTLIGTPEYMSPEQASATEDGVDTRADVYALGAMLYELATGLLPFDPLELRKQGHLEMQRRIIEDEPPRPSQRLRAAASDAATYAERRKATHGELERVLVGDLDWIVMKAIEKEPARRYATVSGLAADVQRYLDDEPVEARPPTTWYRTRKYVRKHRVGVAAVTAVFCGVVVALVATIVNWRDAENRREEILRLSDLRRYEEVVTAAGTLWPCTPENAPRMRAWLRDDGAPLAASLPVHKRRLEELRQTIIGTPRAALPPLAPARRASLESYREKHATMERILDAQVAEPFSRERIEKARHRAKREKDALESVIEEEHRWRFADSETQWEHDLLATLVTSLERFVDPDPRVGLLANVEWRAEFSERVRYESIEAHKDTWEEAVRSIADRAECPQYGGMTLGPQLGLVPIGRDPQSGFWEFAHLQTGEPAVRRADGMLEIKEETGLVFVLLPAGEFVMGSSPPSDDPTVRVLNPDRHSVRDEQPAHSVTLAAFFVSKYEMTQGQWWRVAHNNPSVTAPERSMRLQSGEIATANLTHPVEHATWDETQELFQQLGLFLPTEAQWEYAARGGTTSVWYTGDNPESLIGHTNLADRSCLRAGYNWPVISDWLEDGWVRHAPVGSYAPNPFGLHDVHGNVWEWCLDHAHRFDVPVFGPAGERLAVAERRPLRGGGFFNPVQMARCAERYSVAPNTRYDDTGVRPVRAIDK